MKIKKKNNLKPYLRLLLYFPREVVDSASFFEQGQMLEVVREEQNYLNTALFAQVDYQMLMEANPTDKKGKQKFFERQKLVKEAKKLREIMTGTYNPNKDKPLTPKEQEDIAKAHYEYLKSKGLTK